MRFALLAQDADAIAVARAIVASSTDAIVAVGPCPGTSEIPAELVEFADRIVHWECLLVPGAVDAVLVGRGGNPEQRREILRAMVTAGLATIAVHPACGYLLAVELEMLRRDAASTLVPYYPDRGHPYFERLARDVRREIASKSDHGVSLDFERRLPRQTNLDVVSQFTRDVAHIRAIVGRIDNVHALPSVDGNLSTVQLTSADRVVVSWSAEVCQENNEASLRCQANSGIIAQLDRRAEGVWTLEVLAKTEPNSAPQAWDAALAALQELHAGVDQGGESQSWQQALEDLAVADAATHSLAEGKTVDVLARQYSEEASFKSTMAVGACGVLVLVLLVLVGLAIGDGFRLDWLSQQPWEVPVESSARGMARFVWRGMLVMLLFGFLALQLAWFVARSKPRR